MRRAGANLQRERILENDYAMTLSGKNRKRIKGGGLFIFHHALALIVIITGTGKAISSLRRSCLKEKARRRSTMFILTTPLCREILYLIFSGKIK